MANVTESDPRKFDGKEGWSLLERLGRQAGEDTGCVTIPAAVAVSMGLAGRVAIEAMDEVLTPDHTKERLIAGALDLMKLSIHATQRVPYAKEAAEFVRIMRALLAEVDNPTEPPAEEEEE